MFLPSDTVVRNAPPLSAAVDDHVVMLDPARGEYFGLDPVGSRIWELLAEPRPVDDLCATLVAEFDVDDATCRSEVLAFLDGLAAVELVVAAGP
jgi:hypothetical protein